MLVIVTDNQLLPPQQVCQSCLLADRHGQPRWQNGRLCCGQAALKSNPQLPNQYDCPMGFRVVNIE